jgi:PEP-CTERM motif
LGVGLVTTEEEIGMKINRIIGACLAAGLAGFLMGASASASPITYNTNGPGTGFGGTSLVLNNSSGAVATLTFNPRPNITTGVPSNVSFGNFNLLCLTCTTQALLGGSFFNAFTFDLVITDITDGATGRFVGSSIGGSVFSDVSQITINWAPLQVGPFGNAALTGSFGTTSFTTTVFTGIVAPNSGQTLGRSTVEGAVDFLGSSLDVAAPEPSTFVMVGAALFGLGVWRRNSKWSGRARN